MKRLVMVGAVLLILPFMAFAGTLPDTGQTKCYDDVGNEINPCPQPGEPFYGQDAQYGTNIQSYTKLDVNENDLADDATEWVMVRDDVTGLIWEVKTYDGTIHDVYNVYNWYEAQDVFIATLNSDNFGGYADWRLPTIKEHTYLVDRSIEYPNARINTDYFPIPYDGAWWSSTEVADSPNSVWINAMFYGDFTWIALKESEVADYPAWAVRGAQSTNNFIDNGDGTVTDTDSDLMWQKDTAPEVYYSWEQALSYCENLAIAGYDDWRLPNVNELQSIVDYNRYNPAIDTIFPNVMVESFYWTSTTITDNPNTAWGVNFFRGGLSPILKVYPDYEEPVDCSVRAVRSVQNGPLCPIELIYGEHSAQTKRLRHFRDTILSKTSEGQEVIKLYYQWSPVLVNAMEEDKEFKGEVKRMIDSVLPMIGKDILAQ